MHGFTSHESARSAGLLRGGVRVVNIGILGSGRSGGGCLRAGQLWRLRTLQLMELPELEKLFVDRAGSEKGDGDHFGVESSSGVVVAAPRGSFTFAGPSRKSSASAKAIIRLAAAPHRSNATAPAALWILS